MKSFKTILITGASSGIGAALARHYAGPDICMFLTGQNQERLSAVADICRAQGARVETCLVDVTQRMPLSNWIIQMDKLSPIDLVIANAGISGGTGGAQGASWVDAEYKIFEVNVMGVLNTVLPLVPRMIERQKGQIAIMSSLASFSGWPGAPGYSASKAGVRVYGEALRGTLAPMNIGVSVICPGFVESRMTAANDYKMPLFMDADRAARIMAQGLSINRARITFPWPTAFVSCLIGLMPPAWTAYILAKLPAKPALTITS